MIELSVLSIFFAGLATFFLPCTLPVIVGSIGLLHNNSEKKMIILKQTILFALGFTFIFVLFGGFAGFLGGTFSTSSIFINSNIIPILKKIGGIFLIFFGLTLFTPIKIFSILHIKTNNFRIPKWININSGWGAFSLGVIFASGWSACISPVLGGVLILAADSSTTLYGMFLLTIFSIGLVLPLIFISIFFDFTQNIRFITLITKWASVFSGVLFLFLGFVFLFGLELTIYTLLYKIPFWGQY